MKPTLTALLFAVLSLPSLAGCGRPSDVPHLEAEAKASVAELSERFAELAHRADAAAVRARALPPSAPDSAEAQRVYRAALTAIMQTRAALGQAEAEIKKEAAAGDDAALRKRIRDLAGETERRITEVTADLSAVESWVALAEQQLGPVAPTPPAAH